MVSGGSGAVSGLGAIGGVPAGDGTRRQRRALYRRVDSIVEVNAIIDRNALRDQVRVERVRPERVLTNRQRLETLWVVAEFDRRSALAGMPHARIVAGAAHRDRRVLRQFAVQPVRGVDRGGVGGVAPLRRRQEADRARRRDRRW